MGRINWRSLWEEQQAGARAQCTMPAASTGLVAEGGTTETPSMPRSMAAVVCPVSIRFGRTFT